MLKSQLKQSICDLNNKCNLDNLKDKIIIKGNTIEEERLNELKEKIIELFNINQIKGKNYNFLSNARDISLVKKSLNSIIQAINSVKEEVPYEMIASDIAEAYANLSEIVGDTTDETVIDEMFKNFCVGK